MGCNTFIDWLELSTGYQLHWQPNDHIWIFTLLSARYKYEVLPIMVQVIENNTQYCSHRSSGYHSDLPSVFTC